MRAVLRCLLVIAVMSVLTLGAATLLSSRTYAVENPCDPTFGLLQWCKANHGHFDAKCCCCKFH